MKLTDLFLQNRNINESGGARTEAARPAETLSRQIKALTPGATVRGEILSHNGNEIQIRLSEDLVLDARVDSNMYLDVGKMITFEVRNNGNILQLSPLFANTATDVNVLKALDMAGLPVNERTLQMTELMMRAGLPIDKNSLQQVFREVSQFPDATNEQVVGLHQLNIPVNQDSLRQMEAYSNMSHQIIVGAEEIAGALEDTIRNLVAEGKVIEAAKLYVELVDYALETTINDTAEEATAEGTTVLPATVEKAAVVPVEGAAIVPAEGAVVATTEGAVVATTEGAVVATTEGATVATTEGVVVATTEGTAGAIIEGAAAATAEGVTVAPVEGATVSGGEATPTNLKQLLSRGIQAEDREVLQAVLSDKQTYRALARQMNNTFLIKPEEVALEGKVQELYRKISKQLTQLSHLLEASGNQNTTAYQATANMSQNIDFLQQVNQMYNYIQLPLKLQEGKANGDLYVYTNKRNLTKQEGEISALLHLDMQHLGPVDIYIAMQAQRVNTKFYVAEDEMLDFLESHMDLLTKRLTDKGYQCAVEMKVRDNQECNSGIEPILTQRKQIPIAEYAFDVRT